MSRPAPAMQSNHLHDLHAAAGANLRPAAEAAPLLSYGDVPGEYAAACRDWVVFDETDRGLLRLSGEDAAEFLHRLLANLVLPLEAGHGNRNLLLTAKGKVRFDFRLKHETEGDYLIDCSPHEASAILAALDQYLFNDDVVIEDQSSRCAPLCLLGPAAFESAAKALALEVPSAQWEGWRGVFSGAALTVTRVERCGQEALALDAGPQAAAELWQTLCTAGARPTGRIVADILRINNLAAIAPDDITEDVYPQEARLERAFSLTKGCYIGQEVVAKIDTYGGLNKRLCALRLEHDDPVPRGTRLYRQDPKTDEWRDLGLVTSWAYSFEDDNGRVLAYLKRRHQEPGSVFRVGEGPATATVIE